MVIEENFCLLPCHANAIKRERLNRNAMQGGCNEIQNYFRSINSWQFRRFAMSGVIKPSAAPSSILPTLIAIALSTSPASSEKELPKNNYGKVLKIELRARLAAMANARGG